MTALLDKLGVGGDMLPSQTLSDTFPKRVQGRVAHIDADFIAYQASAETRDELDGIKPRKTFKDMQEMARDIVEHLAKKAGASEYCCHVTASASTKGGRPAQAVQQEYQSSRQGKEKPEYLDRVRAYIASELNGVVHLDQEADDGMCQMNYAAQNADGSWGKSNLSVIVSQDKDLRMVPGLHYDFDTDAVVCVGSPFGTVHMKELKSSSKLLGWGTKFFWAQCIMGDPADTIKGLPAMPGIVHTEYLPTQKYKKALQAYIGAEDEKSAQRHNKVIDAELSKTKRCGPSAAYALLEGVWSDKDAFHLVKQSFELLEKDHGYEFKHWQTGAPVSPTQALLGDMQLLWMRRNKNPLDVVDWLKEVLG